MAGKVCAFLHPNQTKRHFEVASEAQIAYLNNQAAINVKEITQQKNTSLAQIEALLAQELQAIEDLYQDVYQPEMAEFSKAKSEHEELLSSLSFFMIYGKAVINATEQQQELASLASNYTGAVAEETARFSNVIAEHDAKLQALNLYKTEEVAALNAFIDAQKQFVAEQYDVDINSVAVALKGLRDEANSRLNTQLKVLKEQRKGVALNALVLVGAAVAVYAAPALIAAASAGKLAAGAIQVSAVSTGMGAANNLFNGNNTVGVNFTAKIPNYTPKPYVSQNTSPYLPKQNPAVNNYKLHEQGQLDNYSQSYSNYAVQPTTKITYTNEERSSKPVNTRIEVPLTPPVTPKAKTINWPRMAVRALKKDNSPEVLNWQQNNRNRFPRTAAFLDSIAQSKTQRTVDAFADEFAGRPVRFISEEALSLKQGSETQTKQYVSRTLDSAAKAKDFVVEDAERFIKGQVTETGLFFEKIGNFIDDDIERFWNGEETVIGTAIEQEFKALAAMSSEELAAHLGHEAGDVFLLSIGGGGLKAGGRALLKAADTAVVVGREFIAAHKFRSPLVFQFEQNKLYSGFPIDVFKFQNPVAPKAAAVEITAKMRTSFSKETQRLIGKHDICKEQLFEREGALKSATTLSAARIELTGEQIPIAVERGCIYDHITKVQGAQNALIKHVKALKNRLSHPELPEIERLVLQNELSETSRLLDYTEQFVPRPLPEDAILINNPKLQ